MQNRETFGSRLGFILISAGCAIGLGNVWRFPYVVGEYGGGAFLIIYLVFLALLGLPVLVMEFAVGRASKKSAIRSFHVLQKPNQKWHWHGYAAMAGNYLLMMFYTTISGWMVAYILKMASGSLTGLPPEGVAQVFADMQAQPLPQIGWMVLVVVVGFLICGIGLRKGVEKSSKIMMTSLLAIMIVLVIRSVTLPGAAEGVAFLLTPDLDRLMEHGVAQTISAAMGQAFFTLSVGIGSMAIFGSYINKEHRLTGEALSIMSLDTFVAILAGLMVIPACFAFGINPGSGPGLVFVTLPNVFNTMPGGQIWGTLFFVFLTFAAMSTVIAVFENIVSFGMDLWGWSRKKSAFLNTFLVIGLSLPCVLGFNVWSDFQPFGASSNVLALEDFIVSNNLLPIGSLVYLTFCVSRYGWGYQNFLHEANTGKGILFPSKLQYYLKWGLPFVIVFVFVQGYIVFFAG